MDPLVLYRLDELKESVAKMSTQVDSLRNDVAHLKMRASLWGMVAGTIPGVITLLISLLSAC